MKLILTRFSLNHPRLVLAIVAVLTLLLAFQFPKVHFDNDPENMLAPDEHVRVFHNQIKKKYQLYDFLVVGVVNHRNPDGVFNVKTLGRVYDLTAELASLHPGKDGKLQVTLPRLPARPERQISLDLSGNWWSRVLDFFFRHDPNHLFDEKGRSAIIAPEIISPSLVDNIKQAELGSLKLDYLMERPPTTRAEALTIRDDAMNNPLYRGTLVSEDGKALCLYIPLRKKSYSYNVAQLVKALTRDWGGEDTVYITGLPVAEDTFGVEMLVQMATSAPLAGLAVFLLLLLFFRRVSLISAPMILAVVTIICTMGLLIGFGNDVHIMSSMIAIFLMPIAVADSVHILSEFFDVYHRFNDKATAVEHVIGHLFMPMLYTSLTTVAGFLSLVTTPIPPVQVFGLYVASGVALAWVLTMTFIPAYIMILVPQSTLDKLAVTATAAVTDLENGQTGGSRLDRMLTWLGKFSYARYRLILGFTLVVVVISIYGITRISVNDNPVKWFTPAHPIRIADKVLNEHFGGTYTAYLTFRPDGERNFDPAQAVGVLTAEAKRQFSQTEPEATKAFVQELGKLRKTGDKADFFKAAEKAAAALDARTTASWENLSDTINYLEPENLDHAALLQAVAAADGVHQSVKTLFTEQVKKQISAGTKGENLQDAALKICDAYTALSFGDFISRMEPELVAPLFKRPLMLRYIADLQKFLNEKVAVVGKTSSAVDALEKASYELQYVAPPPGADAQEKAAIAARNQENFSVPNSAAAVGQVFTQLEGMKKKDFLFHLITRDYQDANIWVQLKSGDNKDMEEVVRQVREYLKKTPPPFPIKAEWAGLTYLNVIWQNKMVIGMLKALSSSFAVVLIMMLVLFRSVWFGILSMIPLTVTITFIYGLIGLVGKDYDMPVAVLSSLTLGLSVDFAIHFLQRAREMEKQYGNWRTAITYMFNEPAMAISRNAITISVGFMPLLVAPLVPYQTVGFFLATIMAVSWLATLFILAALVTMIEGILFPDRKLKKEGEAK